MKADVHCDVAIIGAGLTGAMVAHALTRAGFHVVLLDKRGVGMGSTSASTALVLYEIDTPLTELIRRYGRSRAVRSYQCCLETIKKLELLVRSLRGKCEFRPRQSLYVASQHEHVEALLHEFEVRRRAGFRVEFLTRPEIENICSFSAPAAVLSADAAELNPFSLARTLTQQAVARGAQLFVDTTATRIREYKQRVVTYTQGGFRIESRWTVLASGFETASPIVRRVVKLKSTYALATRPLRKLPRWHDRYPIWETRRPYLYLRTTPDRRIIVGGEDEDFFSPAKRDRLIPSKTKKLLEGLNRFFPENNVTAKCSWAGTFGETKDGLPYIGQAKSDSRIAYALCYGANGTNFAVLASEIISDLIRGRRNADAKLFGFDR